jgi:putative peptide zinc metalloprotease protein
MVGALTLPALRQELGLFPAPPSGDGTPGWTLHDPAANKFFLLGWPAFEVLSRWGLGTLEAVLEAVNRETTLSLTENDVLGVIGFLEQNFLLDSATSRASDRLAAARAASRPGWAKWLLHNYLFIRMPLIRPQRLLDAVGPKISWLYSGSFFSLVLSMLVAALFLVSHQWDLFRNSFTAYQSFEGLLTVGCAIPLAKVVHEFGHAFTAHRYGCRVPTMGVALVVMTPMLYTDTNEAWKLTSRRQRLAIGVAGIAVELLLALAALWAWLMLPEGPVRGAAFILATTTWIMTLVLNASPFMRFDGYFLLSDFLGIPNLHQRSFAFGRWWLRELVFGLGDPAPELVPKRRQYFLIAFAYTIWVYRFTVFLGIAAMVYHYFFKALGIFLFAVEIGWFVIMPFYQEFRAWYRMRERIRLNFAVCRGLALLAGLVGLAVIPWKSHLMAPAVLSAAREQQVSVEVASMVLSEPAADAPALKVKAGEVLLQLSSPDMEQRIRQVRTSTTVSRWQVTQQSFDERLLSQGEVPRRRFEGGATELSGLKEERERLTLRAPIDGSIVDRNDELTPGLWLPRKEPLYVIADTSKNRVDAYVGERDLERISAGASARFIPDAGEFGTFQCRVAEIDRVNLAVIDEPFLSSIYGGPIAAHQDSQGAQLPEEPVFRIRMDSCLPAGVPLFKLKGVARIEAQKRSSLLDVLRNAQAVVVREMGM